MSKRGKLLMFETKYNESTQVKRKPRNPLNKLLLNIIVYTNYFISSSGSQQEIVTSLHDQPSVQDRQRKWNIQENH